MSDDGASDLIRSVTRGHGNVFLWIFSVESPKDGVRGSQSGRACRSEIKSYSANGPPA